MATAELNPTIESPAETQRVTAWRFDQLRAAGYDKSTATELAERADVDLHVAVELLRNGCSVELARRILS